MLAYSTLVTCQVSNVTLYPSKNSVFYHFKNSVIDTGYSTLATYCKKKKDIDDQSGTNSKLGCATVSFFH